MFFTKLEEAQNWIENIKRFGSKLDLTRMNRALDILERPERKFKSIHVAGTNGKGSTANYLKNILFEAGYKTGIYTSPYIVKFNERIGINDEYISDADIVKYANEIRPLWDEFHAENDPLTFFEVLTIIGFLYFRDQHVDYAVIEVGLGGLLDATNVIIPEISAITNISYDHMKQLGNTLESIALNKLGIVKEGVPLVTSIENKNLFPLIYEVTGKKHSRVKIVNFNYVEDILVGETTKFTYRKEPYELNLTGYHQVKNACLAIEIIHLLRAMNNLKITEQNIKNGLFKTKWPGRFEIFNHNVILDGAHNIGGIVSLKKTIENLYQDKYVKCLLCIMEDKEHQKIIEEMDNFCDEIYFTEIEYSRRADAEELFLESHHHNKSYAKDYKEIFLKLKKELKKDEVLVVTGSLYFISAIRKLLTKN